LRACEKIIRELTITKLICGAVSAMTMVRSPPDIAR
jgi:hypothetical protein